MPVPWPNASPRPCRASTSRAAASISLAGRPAGPPRSPRPAPPRPPRASRRSSGAGGAKLQRPRKIHAVSVVDAPEVQHHPVAGGQPARVPAGRADGRCSDPRRRSSRTRAARTRRRGWPRRCRRRPPVRIALAARIADVPRATAREPPGRFPQRGDLERVLDGPSPLDDPLGRHEGDAAGWARRGSGERGSQRFETG